MRMRRARVSWLRSFEMPRKAVVAVLFENDGIALKLWDKTVWLQKGIDKILPWKGLSLVMIARKPR